MVYNIREYSLRVLYESDLKMKKEEEGRKEGRKEGALTAQWSKRQQRRAFLLEGI
jgi:hypothetical protein